MSREVQYARPRSVAQAVALLQSLGAGASVIAGGQELMPTINYGVFSPSVLVDINGLRELRGVRLDQDCISIGALSVHKEVESDALVARYAPLLANAVTHIGGGWQVRNRGTIGGNLVSMHPLYDVLPALIALKAQVVIHDGQGERLVPIAELIRDAKHGLGTSALISRVNVPLVFERHTWGYYKLKATHGAYASATAACLVALGEGGELMDVRLVVGSVQPLPLDLSQPLLDLMRGQRDTANLLRQCQASVAAAVASPLSDQRGDEDYRRAMAGVAARRALQQAVHAAPSQPAH